MKEDTEKMVEMARRLCAETNLTPYRAVVDRSDPAIHCLVSGIGIIARFDSPDDLQFMVDAPATILALAAEAEALREQTRWKRTDEAYPPIVPSTEEPKETDWVLVGVAGLSGVRAAYVRSYENGKRKWVTTGGVGSTVKPYHMWRLVPAPPKEEDGDST